MKWLIKVESDSGRTYEIKPAEAEGKTGIWCNCPAFINTRQRPVEARRCKHTDYVLRELAEQFERSRS